VTALIHGWQLALWAAAVALVLTAYRKGWI
jgi:hypothetical protein